MSVDKPVRPASEVASDALRCCDARGHGVTCIDCLERAEKTIEAWGQEVRAATLKEAKQAVWDLPSGTFTNTVLRGEALEALDAIEALATRSTEEPAK